MKIARDDPNQSYWDQPGFPGHGAVARRPLECTDCVHNQDEGRHKVQKERLFAIIAITTAKMPARVKGTPSQGPFL